MYLNEGCPQNTFFQVIYRRHRNFASVSMESMAKSCFFARKISQWYRDVLKEKFTIHELELDWMFLKDSVRATTLRSALLLLNAQRFVKFIHDVNRLDRQVNTAQNILTGTLPTELVKGVWSEMKVVIGSGFKYLKCDGVYSALREFATKARQSVNLRHLQSLPFYPSHLGLVSAEAVRVGCSQ